MHRLGFDSADLSLLIPLIEKHSNLTVASIFTHLARADNPQEDSFTLTQIKSFNTISNKIKES